MRTTDSPTKERAGRGRFPGDNHVAGTRPWGPAWRPLAGAALLERIRVTGRPRMATDPVFTAELRALIESGLTNLSAESGLVDGGRLVVTKDRLTRALSCPVHRTVDRFGERAFTIPLACGALVEILFRQVVTVGTVGDPMTEALEGLAMDGRQAPLIAWIVDLAAAELAELRAEVNRQAQGLAERWPILEASWLPRTQESLRAVLAVGRVELSARVDLAIGCRAEDEASVAIVDVKSGARRPGHRDDLRFYALVEALCSPAPPFAVATYYSRTGELDVEPVTHELVVESAQRCLAGARALAGGTSESEDGAWCAMCPTLPRRAVEPVEPVEPVDRGPDAGLNPVDVLLHRQAA
jgi:hypothetical protein